MTRRRHPRAPVGRHRARAPRHALRPRPAGHRPSSTSTSCCRRFRELIGAADPVRRVRRLPARREARRAVDRPTRSAIPRRGDAAPRCGSGEGLVGAAVAEQRPLLVNDVAADPRYVEFVPGMHSALVVPLLHKSQPIGALNILSLSATSSPSRDVAIAAPVRGARRGRAGERAAVRARARSDARRLRNARGDRPRSRRRFSISTSCCTRIAQLTKRVIDYRTFGILLLNDRRTSSR